MEIAFNAVYRVTAEDMRGLWRVVACPIGRYAFLAHIGELPSAVKPAGPAKRPSTAWRNSKSIVAVCKDELKNLHESDELTPIDLTPPNKCLKFLDELPESDRVPTQQRLKAMEAFFEHGQLCEAFLSPRGLGPLVKRAAKSGDFARTSIYKLFWLLCKHGFEPGSLNTFFDRCGAPGVARPSGEPKKKQVEGENPLRAKAGRKTLAERLGVEVPNPQRGYLREDVSKSIAVYRSLDCAKLTFTKQYERIVEAGWVTRYVRTPSGKVKPVAPREGTFPNMGMMRRIIERHIHRIDRWIKRTTQRHFDRNFRGLSGYSWQNVAGPGHAYVMDSTLGKAFLRSSVNRAWIIGRPIVYLIVDLWSTAIVGFHVCLTGPSWATAKTALFSAFAPPELVASLWGFTFLTPLVPAPLMCSELHCDRAEYLSLGALLTARELGGLSILYNPAYRPDLKGLVEVLNRIVKDEGYAFIPGAVDRRRKEMELQVDAAESVMTLREYVHFLYVIIAHYNFFADRRHRLDDALIAAKVIPTPAGLWRFGHDAQLGYGKDVSKARLIRSLLPEVDAVVRSKGPFVGPVHYESELAKEEQWATLARNEGVRQIKVHHFPGSLEKVWMPEGTPDGLHEFTISPHAKFSGSTSLVEALDAVAYSKLQNGDQAYQRLIGGLMRNTFVDDLVARATEATERADAEASGPRPTVTDARSMELLAGSLSGGSAADPAPLPPDPCDAVYQELMRETLAEAA